MTKYRTTLPQLNGNLFLTDGGLETTLIFEKGVSLRHFAAFDILNSAVGDQLMREYYTEYIQIAKKYKTGFILESPTWRANSDWGEQMGYSRLSLALMNLKAIKLLEEIRTEEDEKISPIVISGCIGPRGDGYNPNYLMNSVEAEHYHSTQIATFSETNADMITALTISYADEAIGIARAAKAYNIPVVISFTVETDGWLPSGESLKETIEWVDAATDNAPAYYMLNCAHPSHFTKVLNSGEAWLNRIHGIRANASSKSHAELDDSVTLDTGSPIELGKEYRILHDILPKLNVLGGCCGTDHNHLSEIYKACSSIWQKVA